MAYKSNAVKNTLVIGVGNIYRNDDGAGLVAADKLQEINPGGVEILKMEGDAVNIIETWENRVKVIIIDAVSSGGLPGSVSRYDVTEKSLPAELLHFSTHSISFADIVEIARSLGRLPECLIIYGIEGSDFEHGSRLSPEVVGSLDGLLERIKKDLKN